MTPNLLNDDGSASIATGLMMSHHGFRRDLLRFARALEAIARGDASRADAVKDEWKSFRATLHAHHEAEDTALFAQLPRDVAATIAALTADHRTIDPLLERGDVAFAELPRIDGAAGVIEALRSLLGPHLAREEAEIVPHFRDVRAFPPAAGEEMAAAYAEGFAWAMDGVAPEVLEKVQTMLPEPVRARLPAARAAFEARCVRAWGPIEARAARTPVPEGW